MHEPTKHSCQPHLRNSLRCAVHQYAAAHASAQSLITRAGSAIGMHQNARLATTQARNVLHKLQVPNRESYGVVSTAHDQYGRGLMVQKAPE
jgi:hypothetical protein